jgi:predicted RNase H-like HicB family nuclease
LNTSIAIFNIYVRNPVNPHILDILILTDTSTFLYVIIFLNLQRLSMNKESITAIIHTGDDFGYVAECIEISVVTQGDSLDEVVKNCTDAVFLHLEGENPEDFGLIEHPAIRFVFELQPIYA